MVTKRVVYGEVTQQDQTGGRAVADKRVDLAYDALGRFTSISRFADMGGTALVAATEYAYDPKGRLSRLSHAAGNGTSLADYLYGYDFADRLTWQQTPSDTIGYAYDPTGQLTFADHSSQADETYGFDRTGNFATVGYETDENNRPAEDATYTYEYDDEGNQTKRTQKADAGQPYTYTSYAWDHENRLTRVELHSVSGTAVDTLTKAANYRYDAFGRLIERTVDGDSSKTVRFVYDDAPGKDGLNDIVLAFDGSGNVKNRYLHGPAVDQLFSDESAVDGLLWSLADRQGTVTDWLEYDDVSDQTTVYDHVEYDSFGNKVSQTNSGHTITLGGYTGRWHDPETGLTNHRARWTQNGRWLSEDPIGFDGGDVNLRRYVGNSPTSATDPSGLQARHRGNTGYHNPGSGPRGYNPPRPGRIWSPEQYPQYRPPRRISPTPGNGFRPGPYPLPQGVSPTSRPTNCFTRPDGKPYWIPRGVGPNWRGTPPQHPTFAEPAIRDLLGRLPKGKQNNVRTVETREQLEAIFNECSRNTSPIVSSYPGPLIRLMDGTTVGIRQGSRSGGPTIDITFPGGQHYKVHIHPWPPSN